MNAIGECMTIHEKFGNMQESMKRLARYLPIPSGVVSPTGRKMFDADSLRFIGALDLFGDFNVAFARYMQRCQFEAAAANAGAQLKKANTLVAEWPLRLRDNATEQEFQLLLASNEDGAVRYCEWTRI
jgi:hypothetical protein